MREILPSLFHWTTVHPKIHIPVASYWLDGAGVAIDPLLPEEGVEWFAARPVAPVAAVLSNRHHLREAPALRDRFGARILAPRAGMHEFQAEDGVEPYEPGAELPGGLVVHVVGVLCPDEMALHLPALRALVVADGVVRAPGDEGPLGFVPDSLMDEPEQTKAGLLAAYRRLLDELDFDHLLLAHGGPVLGDGRAQLEDLVASGGRTAFEM